VNKSLGVTVWSLLHLLLVSAVLSAVAALVFLYSPLQESARPLVGHVILYIGIFAMGYQRGLLLHNKGFLHGVMTAACCCVLVLITTLILQHRFTPGFSGMIGMFVKFSLTAGIGAIIGQAKYNRKRKARRNSSYNVR